MSMEVPEAEITKLPKKEESPLPTDAIVALERNKVLEQVDGIFKQAKELLGDLKEGNSKVEQLLHAFSEEVSRKDMEARKKIEEGDLEAAFSIVGEIRESSIEIGRALKEMESAIQKFLFDSNQIAMGHRDNPDKAQ